MPTPTDNPIQIELKGETAEVLIYDFIGKSYFEDGVSAKGFAENLKALGKGIKTINVRINSPGGSVFDGTAIYNTLRNHGAKIVTIVEGAALSIASLIAMAGDERRMAKNGYLMIHDPMSAVRGRADDMRKTAELLDKVKNTICGTYAERSGRDQAEISLKMSAETWLNAADAKELGFVHDVSEDSATALASFDPSMFSNVPADVLNVLARDPRPTPEIPMATTETNALLAAPLAPAAATIKEIKAGCPGITNDFAVTLLEEAATLAQAQSRWMAKQSELLAASQTELATAKAAAAELAKKPPAKPGVPALTANKFNRTAAGGRAAGDDEEEGRETEADWSADPLAGFEAAVTAHMKRAGVSRHVATQAVCRNEPELREAMVAAHNVAHEAARKRERKRA